MKHQKQRGNRGVRLLQKFTISWRRQTKLAQNPYTLPKQSCGNTEEGHVTKTNTGKAKPGFEGQVGVGELKKEAQ